MVAEKRHPALRAVAGILSIAASIFLILPWVQLLFLPLDYNGWEVFALWFFVMAMSLTLDILLAASIVVSIFLAFSKKCDHKDNICGIVFLTISTASICLPITLMYILACIQV